MTAGRRWIGIVTAAAAPLVAIDAQAPAAHGETTLDGPARIVGEGTISTPAEEFKATVSPDGTTLLYTVTDHRFRRMTIVQAVRRGSEWSGPEVVPFSGVWRDGDPSFAPDGRTLLFISNRPLPGDPRDTVRRDFSIWEAQRRRDGRWSEPVALDRGINTAESEFAPSLSAAGTLYFSRGAHMYRAAKRGAGFDVPAVLPIDGGDPAISPDERFLVFDSDGPTAGDADLFVSCRQGDGWSAPSRVASPVSTPQEEGDPSVSADGRTLYFFSRRFTPAPERAPRQRRATYAQVEREALNDVYNGSRNVYEIALPRSLCAGRAGGS